MNGWRGLLAGALGLAALEVAVSSSASASRAGGILSTLGTMARRFLDPSIPAFTKPAKTPQPNDTGNALSPVPPGGPNLSPVPGPGNGSYPLPNLSPGVPLPSSITVPSGTRVVSG